MSIGSVKGTTLTTMVKTSEEKLCHQVRNYTHLYDISLPLHNDKHACQNIWQGISSILGVCMEILLLPLLFLHVCP